MRPRDVRKESDFDKLRSDNFPRRRDVWSILNSEDHVSLHPPADDSGKGWIIRIPRAEFNAIVDWYNREQTPPA